MVDSVDSLNVGIAGTIATDCSGEHGEEQSDQSGNAEWRMHVR